MTSRHSYEARAERDPEEGTLLRMEIASPVKDPVEVPEQLHEAVTQYVQLFSEELKDGGDVATLNSHRGMFVYNLAVQANKQITELAEHRAEIAKIGQFSPGTRSISHRSKIRQIEKSLERREQELESIAEQEQQERLEE